MDLIKLLQATGQQDQILGALAGQFGLEQGQANGAVEQVMKALMGGMQKQASHNGVQPLIKAVMKGNHAQALDNPAQQPPYHPVLRNQH